MVCTVLGKGVIACGPPAGVYARTMRECGECKRRHGFIERHDGAWYGSTFFGGCGDTWMDGERLRRPAEKGWRTKAKEQFRAMWDNAAPADLFEAYVNADMGIACASTDADAERFIDERRAAHQAILEARAS